MCPLDCGGWINRPTLPLRLRECVEHLRADRVRVVVSTKTVGTRDCLPSRRLHVNRVAAFSSYASGYFGVGCDHFVRDARAPADSK